MSPAMVKKAALITFILIISIMSHPASAQGMGGQRGYGMGSTPASNQDYAILPDYLSPYSGESPDWDPYGNAALFSQSGQLYSNAGGITNSAQALNFEAADPKMSGISAPGSSGGKISNQLFVEISQQLLDGGIVQLGEPYTLWAKVSGKGKVTFYLYDFGILVLSRNMVLPGWYRITGATASYLEGHLYSFAASGMQSNNVSITVDRGNYPTHSDLAGLVVDQTGRGISGVKVTAQNSDGGKFSTTTDEFGYYAIDLAKGPYLVRAKAAGYVFTESSANVIPGIVTAARKIIGTQASTGLPSGLV